MTNQPEADGRTQAPMDALAKRLFVYLMFLTFVFLGAGYAMNILVNNPWNYVELDMTTTSDNALNVGGTANWQVGEYSSWPGTVVFDVYAQGDTCDENGLRQIRDHVDSVGSADFRCSPEPEAQFPEKSLEKYNLVYMGEISAVEGSVIQITSQRGFILVDPAPLETHLFIQNCALVLGILSGCFVLIILSIRIYRIGGDQIVSRSTQAVTRFGTTLRESVENVTEQATMLERKSQNNAPDSFETMLAQIYASGLSFFAVAVTVYIATSVLIFFGIIILWDDFTMAMFLFVVAGIIGLAGTIGLLQKLATDSISLGIKNFVELSDKNPVSLRMNTKETLQAGLRTILAVVIIFVISGVIAAIGSVPSTMFSEEVCNDSIWTGEIYCTNQPTLLGIILSSIFYGVSAAALLSGLLGISTRAITDSITRGLLSGRLVNLLINSTNEEQTDGVDSDFMERPTPPPDDSEDWTLHDGNQWLNHQGRDWYRSTEEGSSWELWLDTE